LLNSGSAWWGTLERIKYTNFPDVMHDVTGSSRCDPSEGVLALT
jgi:hypothetical protein